MHNTFSRKSGFSLIEMLLVLIILSIIIGLTVPNFSGTYSRVKLKKSVSDLVYLMRYAQSRAVSKTTTVRLAMDQNRYWLEEEVTHKDDTAYVEYARISNRYGRVNRLPEDYSIETEDKHIHFYPDASIEKSSLKVCRDQSCFIVSTKLQRGHVYSYEAS